MPSPHQQPLVLTLSAQLSSILPSQIACQQEALWLLKYVCQGRLAQGKAVELITAQELTPSEQQLLDTCLERRIKQQEPLAYIIGTVPFCNLWLKIKPPILIPRLETEEWCEMLLHELTPYRDKKLSIVDLCTGSGCIALALAKALPQSQIIGIDLNPMAISLAKQNAQLCQLRNVSFIQADLFKTLSLPNNIDLLTANPPYISPEEWRILPSTVKDWEDQKALLTHDSGLAFYPIIAALAAAHLTHENGLGWSVVEIGHQQCELVGQIFEKQQFTEVAPWRDSFGHDRAIIAKK